MVGGILEIIPYCDTDIFKVILLYHFLCSQSPFMYNATAIAADPVCSDAVNRELRFLWRNAAALLVHCVQSYLITDECQPLLCPLADI